jgi:DNA-binding NarL/FixJ family response regulator
MRQGRVLLADSHLPMLQGVRSLLESRFAAVVMVADEASLLETIERLDPDLVVVDLSMPVQEGANVARQLMGRFPGLRLIVLSVHDEPTVAAEIRHAGVMGFVLKRTAAIDLIPAVEAVLGGGSFVSPTVSERASRQPHRS